MADGVWRRVFLIVAGLGVLGALGAAIAIGAGLILTSARPPHSALTTFVLHTAFKQSVARGAGEVVVPADLDLTDPGLIRLGGEHFANTCASCHGGPGMGQSPLALSMRPSPQHLPAVVGQFTDAELFWILREGVRFSPMPAWPAEGNFDEIWAVVAFLRQLPGMTADDFASLRTGPMQDAPATPWGETGPLSDVSLGIPSQPAAEYAYSAPTPGWTPIGLDERPLARCAACHGADGSGTPTGGRAPNLTILSAADIETALRAYAEGRRESGIMAIVASALSGDQIAALARHFAETLPDAASPPGGAGDAARGAVLANLGKPETGVPACLSCHAEVVRTRLPLSRPPSLAGQSHIYLQDRLDAFAEAHALGGGPAGWHPMPAIAAGLDQAGRADVAAYFAGLAPGQAPQAEPAAPPVGAAAVAETLLTGVCAKCHTASLTGDAAAGIPNLTGQRQDYLARQLWAFHLGQRRVAQMQEVGQRLTAPEIAALAARLGTLPAAPGQAETARPPTPEALEAAGKLAETGDPARGIPACSACHGAAGLAFAPRLDGQGRTYLDRRLSAFAEGRDAAGWSPMRLISAALTAEERRALAGYFATR